jgi:hypothetical protein
LTVGSDTSPCGSRTAKKTRPAFSRKPALILNAPRRPGETSKRLVEDAYAKFKYDATAEADARIIARVAEVAEARGISMTEVSIAWLLTKVASPVVGATKPYHVLGAVSAVDLELSSKEVAYLEEPYTPHAIVGVMAQNKPADAGKEHVWLANAKYLKAEQR